ncbi:MAG: hypothetical protein OXE40_12020 [Gammaproteobacteria bacterium]|nr:hypothetical protein [Gammaproteobacteria bacterium]
MPPPPFAPVTVAAQAPEEPSPFDWTAAYANLQLRSEQARTRGDTYAISAYDDAIKAIDTEVMENYRRHDPNGSERGAFEPVGARDALTRLAQRAGSTPRNPGKESAIREALSKIDTITHRRRFNLGLRDREFTAVAQNVPASHSVFPPDREGLNHWLRHEMHLVESIVARALDRHDLSAAIAARFQYEHYLQLSTSVILGGDPWTASRALVRHSISEGNLTRVWQLQAAHRRLLLAMADRALQSTARTIDTPIGPLARPENGADSPETEPDPMPEAHASSASTRETPPDFNWCVSYLRLREQRDQAAMRGDSSTSSEYCRAIDLIERAVLFAYRFIENPTARSAEISPEAAYLVLSLLQVTPETTPTVKRNSKSLTVAIDRLTYDKQVTLATRDFEKPSSSGAPESGRIPGFLPGAATPRQLIVHQIAIGQPLSRRQAGEIAWRASLADSLGWPGTSGYGVMRNLPGYLAGLSAAAGPTTNSPLRGPAPELQEFDGVLAKLETAGCL